MDVGDVVGGKYELLRKVGEGGMGAVYEARHTTLGRRVAVKLLRPEMVGNTEVVVRFLREARAAASIGSDHIVEIIDVADTSEGEPFLVMEYLEGDDLATILHREGALEPSRAVRLVRQVCLALSQAHDQGIVHRDLKPENVFVTRGSDGGERAKILDFGVAMLHEPGGGAETPRLTATGAALGTPYYMAPEQAQGAKDVDLRVDVYSTGVMLYELLTSRRPFSGESFAAIVIAIATVTPPRPRELRPGLDGGLEAVVLRAMARDRQERHPTMGELSAALEPFANPEAHTLGAGPLPMGQEDTIAADSAAAAFLVAGAPGSPTGPSPGPSMGSAVAPQPGPVATPPTSSSIGAGASMAGPAPTLAPEGGKQKGGSRLGVVIAVAALAALVVGGGGTAAVFLALRGCGTPAPTAVAVVAPEQLPPPPAGGAAPTAVPAVATTPPSPPSGGIDPEATTTPASPAAGAVAGAPAPPVVPSTEGGEPTSPPAAAPAEPPPAAKRPTTTKAPATKTPPFVAKAPPTAAPRPQKRPAAEAFADARGRWRAHDFQGCIRALRNAEKSPQVISLNIRCHDRAVGRAKACQLAERCPSLRWCRRFVSRHCR